jgi:hypothetical protein
LESLADIDPAIVQLVLSPEDFYWAFVTVRSRCLAVSDDDIVRDDTNGARTIFNKDGSVRVMLPGFDLFNNQFGAQVAPNFKDSLYVFHSNDTYQKGEQVFISYSGTSGRDNLNMFMTYGFCPAGNPESAIIFVDNQDLLGACASARPAFFNNKVIQQLEGLLTDLGKTKDLYVYDGSRRQPRSRLVNGISMMAEIEKQLLPPSSPQDPDFAYDVLQALVFARQQELDRGLERIVTLLNNSNEKGASWEPMLHSVQTLLSIEQRYLSSTTEASEPA